MPAQNGVGRHQPTVLYIVGCGRSGSTVLERMLGAVPGFVNGGELIGLFPRVAVQDQQCGCGEPFSACSFWRAVGQHAYGGWQPEGVARVARLQRRLIRQRHVPELVQPRLAAPSFRRALHDYVDTYARLYAGIAAVSGARVVVDASKSPAQLMAMRQLRSVDMRVLNLVRDPRGVAHSWAKTGIALPHVHNRREMRTYAPGRTALMWSVFQLESTYLQAVAAQACRVRYEDLVDSPRLTLSRALTSIGLPAEVGWLDHVGDTGVTLEPSHGVAGSRSRFTSGRVELRRDDDWRVALAPTPRRVVTALTLPQLAGYGYLRRPKVVSHDS